MFDGIELDAKRVHVAIERLPFHVWDDLVEVSFGNISEYPNRDLR
jgi:hypothetical protein